MTILVTGATGTVGSKVLHFLNGGGADVRALTRSPDKAKLPAGVTAVQGDLGDVDSIRAAMNGVSTLFLVVGNTTDELSKAMLTLNVARDAKVKGIVYLSVFKGEDYADVPHFASKVVIERMIEVYDLPATILRPCYFFQNDAQQKDALLTHSVYGMPIGRTGLSLVDTRDIGEAAAKELLRREQSATPLPRERYALVGPDVLTGPDLAALWSRQLGYPITYGGDDLAAFEQSLRAVIPNSRAYDIAIMMRRYQIDGAIASTAEIEKLTGLLGHPPRSYSDFARELAAAWKSIQA
ncbi:NAD(P)H azoreductase [Paraburkholderia sediminicola]|uniref:NAD(P)H azoreductase n=1 Tax=Paraburkholderia sediminicola TaxID=458836 RepID=A0A6J5BK60_9BURK|nr:NmrA family NAD(P)-binding protein [Paraburkholderia sediminicola]CAB3707118.1 NAD(P)H azoreductase [Paraburkholderia sediminicola]